MRVKALDIELRVDEALEKCFSTKVRTLAVPPPPRPRRPSRR
jgi:hypothetical protein